MSEDAKDRFRKAFEAQFGRVPSEFAETLHDEVKGHMDQQEKDLIKALWIISAGLVICFVSIFLNAHIYSDLWFHTFVAWFGLPDLGAGKLFVLLSSLKLMANASSYVQDKSHLWKDKDPLPAAKALVDNLIGQAVFGPVLVWAVLRFIVLPFSG